MVGSPGRVIKALTEEQIKGLTLSAAHYVENAERFRTDLAPIDSDDDGGL